MAEVKKEGVILRQTDLDFENDGVLNPAVWQEGNTVHLFYRAVRKGNYSSIGYCKLNGPLKIAERMNTPFLSPQFDYEKHGMEDPRIVKIDDLYYLSYVAFDDENALGALATSTNLQHFDRKGIIVPQISYDDFDLLTKNNTTLNEKYLRYNRGAKILADKDFVFFPRRINGKLTFLHRIKPDIQIVSVSSLNELTDEFWKDYFSHFEEHIFLSPKFAHEVSYVGAGCPPVETPNGWLVLYHGVKDTVKGYQYSCCAALFDLNAPQKEIARLSYPLFKPELEYELMGDVDDVCFPTGTALFGDVLYIYYGAADELIACACVQLSALLEELTSLSKCKL
ncbi:glycoside hydrolase family 130 protein [Mucilaginibacter xinganensis]|uniref:Pesticidal protein Cry7Aa n=1 Tax=Mucilaginibacter xinganensis TaxID=1234841 RepID=A0A223NTF3_9SPHI|nr:pesticidal protein Cry7Aa [Mucilaginibacter xinganensis]ASU33050.1 pesticidal protein Cry7Aa [Mucilaginibacter xinganensis]